MLDAVERLRMGSGSMFNLPAFVPGDVVSLHPSHVNGTGDGLVLSVQPANSVPDGELRLPSYAQYTYWVLVPNSSFGGTRVVGPLFSTQLHHVS